MSELTRVEASMPPTFRIHLRPGRERAVELRHPWVFSGAVDEIEALEEAVPGDVGDVYSAKGEFLARGTVHPESQIVCRILTWNDRRIDADFFAERIDRALSARASVIDHQRTTAARLINAEGDGLPGLIVDRYQQSLVVQTLSAGMLRARPLWLEILVDRLGPTGVLERGDHSRREEVDAPEEEVIYGLVSRDPVVIKENGLSFRVDLFGGQKTGFYLDQRDNRALLREHASGARVLNLFGYTGAFSVYAGSARAESVTHVESSGPACALAEENWELNNLPPSRLEVVETDAFGFLRQNEERYDRIILDPPPLARNRGSVQAALRAYKDLHLWAFLRSEPGTEILTFSCSQHVTPDLFQKVVFGAALDVGASVQWLSRLGPGVDHPVHLNHPQGEYLKGFRLRVLEPGQERKRPSTDEEGEA